jgi:hypothetical protein
MKKILAIVVILTVVILLVSTFALALSPTISGNVANIFGAEEGISEPNDVVSNIAVDSVDVYELEEVSELEVKTFAQGEEGFRSRKMVQVQGFTFNDQSKEAALINGLFLKNTIYLADDTEPGLQSVTKGKLKIAGKTFDAKRVGSDDDSVTLERQMFELRGSKDEVGILSIAVKPEKIYNDGRLKVWEGTLEIDGNDMKYNGDVILYTKEKILRPKPVKPIAIEPGFTTKTSFSGVLELEGKTYKFDDSGDDSPRRLEAHIYGESDEEGKFSLRDVKGNNDDTERTYNSGKILIQDKERDLEIKGSAFVTISREAQDINEWNGKIIITGEKEDFAIEGKIQLFEEITQVNKARKESSYNGVAGEVGEDKDYSKSSSSGSKKGFFGRFWDRVFS